MKVALTSKRKPEPRPTDTKHHWRVKAFGENLESAWSPQFSFVTGVAVSVEDPVAERPSGFRFHQNYPNPFNPPTRITYDVPEPAHVLLRVFDALGREVAVLVDQQQSPGRPPVRESESPCVRKLAANPGRS